MLFSFLVLCFNLALIMLLKLLFILSIFNFIYLFSFLSYFFFRLFISLLLIGDSILLLLIIFIVLNPTWFHFSGFESCLSSFHTFQINFLTFFTILYQLLLFSFIVYFTVIVEYSNFIETWYKLLEIQIFTVYWDFLEQQNNFIFI